VPAKELVDGHGDVREIVKPAPTASSDFDDEEPAVAMTPVEAKPSTDKAQDILAMIRARQKA
jgi:hypothetical protein